MKVRRCRGRAVTVLHQHHVGGRRLQTISCPNLDRIRATNGRAGSETDLDTGHSVDRAEPIVLVCVAATTGTIIGEKGLVEDGAGLLAATALSLVTLATSVLVRELDRLVPNRGVVDRADMGYNQVNRHWMRESRHESYEKRQLGRNEIEVLGMCPRVTESP